MKTGSGGSYFNLYYDLKNAEENFVREAKVLKEKNFNIPGTTSVIVILSLATGLIGLVAGFDYLRDSFS